MKQSRRIVVAAVIALLLVAPSLAAEAPPVTVKVAFTPLQSWGPLFIADREGFFAQVGLKIEWVPFLGGADNMPVLIQGGLDVGAGAASAAFLNAVGQGARVRIVADKGHVEPGFKEISLVVRKNLKGGAPPSLADLKGRKIGVNATASVVHYILSRSLARANLTLADVEIVRLPFPAMVTALQQGALDAAVLGEPYVTQSIELGAAALLLPAGEVIPGEPIAFLFYGRNLLDRTPEVGRRFMAGYLRGVRQYVTGPTNRNVAIIADATRVEPALIRKGGWFPIYPDARINVNALRRFQDWLYQQEFIDVRQPASLLVDESFLTSAAGQGR